MAAKHPPTNHLPTDNPDIDSPQSTLQDYFDDLLGFNAASDEPDDIISPDYSPQKLSSTSLSSTPSVAVAPPSMPAVVPKWQPAPEPNSQYKTAIDESTDSAVTAHRARLEKLLASARAQLTEKTLAANPTVAVYVEPEIALAPEIEPEVDLIEPEVETELESEPEPEVVIGDIGIEAFEPEPEHDEYAQAQVEIEKKLAWGSNGRPAWAQERFDVLLFEVGGLTLAVPLISLGQIQPITDELTPLFGQVNWFMGLQPTPMGKIRTVNTALFVMPERYDDKLLAAAKYVISIDGLPWGLAVDKVNQPISLDPDDVKWRTERSKRPWLAGTVKAHMCALIDIPAMGQMLQRADVNSRRRK